MLGHMSITSQYITQPKQSQLTSTIANLAKSVTPLKESSHLLSKPRPTDSKLSSSLVRASPRFQNWQKRSIDNPYLEVYIDKIPVNLASFRNYLFCSDDKGTLCIFTISSTNDLEHQNNYKMPIPSIRSMAANLNFFAITYSNVDRKFFKNKKLKPSGVLLFRRDMNVINFSCEKVIELENGEHFQSPMGIALNQQYVFVCDRHLKSVFKIDFETGCLHARYDMPNGEPYKLSINNDYLVLTDIAQHQLSLHSIHSLEMIKNLIIEQPDGKNGPFSVCITSDNIIFFKNYRDSQLTFVDIDLSNEHVFRRLESPLEGFTLLDCAKQVLVIGAIEKRDKFKFICFVN